MEDAYKRQLLEMGARCEGMSSGGSSCGGLVVMCGGERLRSDWWARRYLVPGVVRGRRMCLSHPPFPIFPPPSIFSVAHTDLSSTSGPAIPASPFTMHMQPLTVSPDDMLRTYAANTAASTPRWPATLFRPPGAVRSLSLHPVSFPFIWALLAPFTSNYPSL
ncbi:hypothetical protein B0H14DRAFT_2773760, partial [Mycena olivaceomarginata]